MPCVERAGLKLYWEVEGEGEPVLLIMGLGASSEHWFRIVPSLAARFRTIRFDNRGIGQSDAPPGPYSIEAMADDAAAVIEAAGALPAHVFGNSMGGMIAQELALRHPGHVRSLVLGCTTCGGRASVRAAKEVLAALEPNPALSREEVFWAAAHISYDASTDRARLAEDFAARASVRRTAEGYLGQLAAVRAWKGTHDRLGRIGVPTLVIHGENDVLIPPENARILASAIPGAQLVLLQGAAHIFLTDRFEPTRDAVKT